MWSSCLGKALHSESEELQVSLSLSLSLLDLLFLFLSFLSFFLCSFLTAFEPLLFLPCLEELAAFLRLSLIHLFKGLGVDSSQFGHVTMSVLRINLFYSCQIHQINNTLNNLWWNMTGSPLLMMNVMLPMNQSINQSINQVWLIPAKSLLLIIIWITGVATVRIFLVFFIAKHWFHPGRVLIPCMKVRRQMLCKLALLLSGHGSDQHNPAKAG